MKTFDPRTHITAERGAETLSETKQPLPYEPKLIAEQCDPLTLRLGCAAGCRKGENFKQCGRPSVAIRRWTRDDGYERLRVPARGGRVWAGVQAARQP